MKFRYKTVISTVLVFCLITCGMVCCADTIDESTSINYVKTLDTLNPINGGFDWNNYPPADPFEDDYSDVCNYFVFHGNYCGNSYDISAEYKIDRQYDVIAISISPYSDCGSEGYSFVQIYADNALVYTSPKIMRKTGKIEAVIDIHGAEYLRIVIRKGENGCVMISDVRLGIVTDYPDTRDMSVISLSTLSPINGSFDWDNNFPADLYDNDYENVNNYYIYHGNYCGNGYSTYAEYRLKSEYTKLTFDVAPYEDFGVDAKSYVQVYVDDVIRYTTPLLQARNGIYHVDVDLTGAEYLKIVINKGENGCMMISDVTLYENRDNRTAVNDGKMSLSELNPFNGEINWNNAHPDDVMGNDYTYSNNYYIYHGNYCGNSYSQEIEYYLKKEYTGFSIDASAMEDFGADGESTVSVFADDELIYTATVNKKNGKQCSGTLNIKGTEYLKIVINKGENGCLMISDAVLIK